MSSRPEPEAQARTRIYARIGAGPRRLACRTGPAYELPPGVGIRAISGEDWGSGGLAPL